MFYLEINPSEHKLYDLPIVHALRRDTKLPNLVTYFNEGSERWVVGLRSECGKFIRELCMADMDTGEGRCPNRAGYQEMLKCFKYLVRERAEEKQELRRQQKYAAQEAIDQGDQYRDSVMAMYRHLHRKYGGHQADQYLHDTGLTRTGPSVIH
jgi:hypothetical protein